MRNKNFNNLLTAVFIIVITSVFGLTSCNESSNRNTSINIDIKDEAQVLNALQGKWQIQLIGVGEENTDIRLMVDGSTLKLYSKNETDAQWNMSSPDEKSTIKIMDYMSDVIGSNYYHRLVHFKDVWEKNDVMGRLSITSAVGSLKIYKNRIELLSTNGKSGFRRGWD